MIGEGIDSRFEGWVEREKNLKFLSNLSLLHSDVVVVLVKVDLELLESTCEGFDGVEVEVERGKKKTRKKRQNLKGGSGSELRKGLANEKGL